TTVFYQPGLLAGGLIEHDCNLQRSIGYCLEGLVCLAPFTKKPVKAILRGITNDKIDPSVVKRGAPPNGGGEVHFTCPVVKKLRPINFTDPGKIKRIRGVSYGMRVSPAMTNRIVEAAKGILLQFLPDIYIYTDHMKGQQAGK
ncbi:RNA 3'-terminal phosphate cyclase-like protein, partial [Saccoglossus kowalevskii]